jgi:SNF2 family DNA or RNA helicase
MEFTKAELKEYLKNEILFDKAEELVYDDHIFNSNIIIQHERKLRITSFCRSSNSDQIYQQKITTGRNKNGIAYLYTECTCPAGLHYGSHCKHSIATLLDYISTLQSDLREATDFHINSWIDNLQNLIAQDTIEKSKKSQHIIQYKFVSGGEKKKDIFGIELVKRKILKKGGFGTSSPLSIHATKPFPSYLKYDDNEIFSYLKQLETETFKNYYSKYLSKFRLWGNLGYLVLTRLIENKKLFYEDSEKLIQFGEAKRGYLSWKSDVNLRKLEVNFDSKNIVFLSNLSKNMYLDKENLLIGEVTGLEFTGETLHKLISEYIFLSDKQLEYASKTLSKKIKSLPPLSKKVITDIKPKPYLHIKRDKVNLSFDYDGKKVQFGDEAKFVENADESFERDFEEEKKFISKLEDFGFQNSLSQIVLGEETADEVENWRKFFEKGIDNLKSDDWKVRVDEKGKFSFQEIDSEDIDFEIEENQSKWFSMDFFIDLDGQKLKLAPIVESFLSTIEDGDFSNFTEDRINIPIGNRNYVRVEREKIKPIVNTVLKLFNKESGEIEVGNHELHDIELNEELEKKLAERHHEIFKLQKHLKAFEEIEKIEPPKGLNADLRQYQLEGLSWLNFLRQFKFGGILADDMGLGKTIQTLGFILNEKEQGRLQKPVLIVLPTSLLGNWKRESIKFTPDLNVKILHNRERKAIYKEIIKGNNEFDILLTTYTLILKDIKELLQIKFYYIILDEAQKIKNPKAKVSKNLRLLDTEYRLCLTGTPMENHLGELWSLFDFLMPNFLYKEEIFNRFLRNPIEKEQDREILARLKSRIKPFILRREKSEVATELPPKTEIIQSVTFDNKQTKLYESIRVTMEKKVQDAIRKNGLAKSQIEILEALLKLRQVCCDPRLLKIDEKEKIDESAKLDSLFNLLEELFEENRKVILFSQFTSMLEIIEERLLKDGVEYAKLTGATRNRDSEIELFKRGGVDIFLVSLKAGGVGLNLTEADTIIIYDPWWNPAVEDQAIDRAYRIGQDKKVFVYRFIVEGSVEEKILELQAKKKSLSKSILEDSAENFQITQEDINELFAPLKSN